MGDFDSVQFPGRFTKIWGRKAKKPRAKGFGARVPEGCKMFRQFNDDISKAEINRLVDLEVGFLFIKIF